MKSFSGSSSSAILLSKSSPILTLISVSMSWRSLSFLLKFMSLTFSPKKRLNNMFAPALERSNTPTVNSAKAIESGVFPIFFLAPYSEKKILTKISPISISVSCTTLKSTDLDSDCSTRLRRAWKFVFMLLIMIGIITLSCSWLNECLIIPRMLLQRSSSAIKMPLSYEFLLCL